MQPDMKRSTAIPLARASAWPCRSLPLRLMCVSTIELLQSQRSSVTSNLSTASHTEDENVEEPARLRQEVNPVRVPHELHCRCPMLPHHNVNRLTPAHFPANMCVFVGTYACGGGFGGGDSRET
jgi:hypothetical protein